VALISAYSTNKKAALTARLFYCLFNRCVIGPPLIAANLE